MEGAFTTRPLTENIGSDATFDVAKYWLKVCLETHTAKCATEISQLPTRVIDVGALDEAQVSLHISREEEIGHWLTLSHCGGARLPHTTTKVNFANFCKGIPVQELPPAFQDAILITRKLGYR